MKHLLFFFLLMMSADTGIGCTVCGGMSSAQTLGILPNPRKHFAGISYAYKEINTLHHSETASTKDLESKETYHTIQLWGRYTKGRVQFYFFAPYQQNTMTRLHTKTTTRGIGDLSLLTSLQLIKPGCNDIKQNLQISGGVKFPTGAYNHNLIISETSLSPMQTGTGSWDLISNASYSLQKGKWGVNGELSSVLTTANSYNYKYGNRFTATLLTFYTAKAGQALFSPLIGARYEMAGRDYEDYETFTISEMSGGKQISSSIGFQVHLSNYNMMLTGHLPLHQHIAGGNAHGGFKTEAGIQLIL
jgi:hypothetical protein